jgi:hypothetical protein
MKKIHVKYFNLILLISTIFGLIFLPTNASAALIISSVSPDIISNIQNNTITITGTDFVLGSVVSLDGYASLATSFFSNTTLMALVPSGIPVGTYSVTVTNPDTSSASLSNSLQVTQTPPTTVAPTQTSEPPIGYERPVLVINSYSTSQEKISPGNSFTLYVTLYNAGQHYAKNVVATFISTDLIPLDTGGVVAVGEIAPSNRLDFAQPLLVSTDVWGTIASISMLVSYADETGFLFSETFVITLSIFQSYSTWSTPTPTPTLTPTPSVKPQLVITGYTTDIAPLQPGLQFNLAMTVNNLGNSTANRISMIIGGGSGTSGGDGGTQQPGGISGSSGEFTNFAPIGSSNVQSLGQLSPGANLSANQSLIVNTNTTPGAYPLKISFVYYDEQNRTYTDDQVITLLVYQVPLLDISFYQETSILSAGQPNILPLQVVNLGHNSVVLGNMRVDADTGQFSNNSILVGTLEAGGYFTLDATYIPDQAGSVDFLVTIDYTNDFNQREVITKTLTVDVMDQPIIEPPIDGGQNGNSEVIPTQPETFLQKVWRFILGLIGLDSGINSSQSPISNQPLETVIPGEQPIIVPVQPPLKGP